jgi:hypothetical protein
MKGKAKRRCEITPLLDASAVGIVGRGQETKPGREDELCAECLAKAANCLRPARMDRIPLLLVVMSHGSSEIKRLSLAKIILKTAKVRLRAADGASEV